MLLKVPKELGPEMKPTGEAIVFVETLTDSLPRGLGEHFARPYEMRNLYLSK